MDLESICRLCLRKCGSLKSIFEVVRNVDSVSISCLQMIIYLDFFNVAKNDGFPANVCPKCISKLKSSYAFKKQCENSYKVLLHNFNEIAHVDIKKEPTDALSDIEINDNDLLLHNIKVEFDNSAESLTKISENNNLDKIFNDDLNKDNNLQETPKLNSINISDTSDISDTSKNTKQKRCVPKDIQDALGVDVYSLRNENGDFQCDQCPRIIKYRRPFIEHLEKHLGIKSFFCEICQKSYARKWAHMQTHLKPHLKKFKCDICNKTFDQKGALSIHLNSHSEEKPHMCKICEKSFKTIYALNQHGIIHNSQKDFLCQYCSKAFAQKRNLKTHILFKHSSEKKYNCAKCDKKFTTRYCLTNHERRHLGIKNFHCEHCDKSFTTKSGVLAHLIVHSNERQYTCRVCPVKFKRADNRNKHEMTAHGANIKTKNLI